jgi:flagellar biosynthetic protein FliR
MNALPLWGLVFARVAGALALAPPTGWRHFPVGLRLGVAALVALPLCAVAGPGETLTLSLTAYAAAVLREAALGLLMGLGLWLLIWGAFAAGHLQDVMAGFGGGEEAEGPLASLLYITAILFFLQLNGHHWLLSLLWHSYGLAPAGEAPRVLAQTSWVYWPAMMFAAAVQLAAPVVLAVLLAVVMIASLERVLPGLRAAEVMSGARALLALVALAVVAPLLGAVFLAQVNGAAEVLARWLVGLRG